MAAASSASVRGGCDTSSRTPESNVESRASQAAGTQCSLSPSEKIKRARQYQQIMIRQRFIENTPHQRGGTSRFFHAHAYAENTSDIIVIGRTAMSRTRHRTPPPDHCHGCHSSHATHAIDMRTKQGGSSNRDVIPEGRQRPGEDQGGFGVHTRQPPTPPAGGLQRQRDLTQDQAQQDEIATYQNLDRRLDHNGRDGPCPMCP